MLLREPQDRVFIGDRPSEVIRCEKNRTKYIRGIRFERKSTAPATEKWFSGSVLFNPGLVAIIGNKGSGKSALSDTLGLLGATKNAGSFSFLSECRFRHATEGRAEFFNATLEWSLVKPSKCLVDDIRPEEFERLKYLPQDHVEKVCNEIVGLGEEGFERELKSVIFSHVPTPQRIGHGTLDDVVRFQTGEKQKRIDSLLKQLREVSRSRAILESQADPAVKRELLEKIERRKLELEAHEKSMPTEIPNPATCSCPTSAEDISVVERLSTAEARKGELNEEDARADAKASDG